MKILAVSALFMLSITSMFALPAYSEEPLQGYLYQERMAEVIDSKYQAAVVEMKYTYDVLNAQLGEDEQKGLATAQKGWEKYSETECTFYVKLMQQDAMEELTYKSCLIGMTEGRTKTLTYYLSQGESLATFDVLKPQSANK